MSLLAESYNPHVRYGAAMALGIACAGTGLREAIALLEPMVKFDPVNFVRQGALVSFFFHLTSISGKPKFRTPLHIFFYLSSNRSLLL